MGTRHEKEPFGGLGVGDEGEASSEKSMEQRKKPNFFIIFERAGSFTSHDLVQQRIHDRAQKSHVLLRKDCKSETS